MKRENSALLDRLLNTRHELQQHNLRGFLVFMWCLWNINVSFSHVETHGCWGLSCIYRSRCRGEQQGNKWAWWGAKPASRDLQEGQENSTQHQLAGRMDRRPPARRDHHTNLHAKQVQCPSVPVISLYYFHLNFIPPVSKASVIFQNIILRSSIRCLWYAI